MERYLYILIILFIFICIFFVCNGCSNLYEGFNVSNDINISDKLILTNNPGCKSAPIPSSEPGEPPIKPAEGDFPKKPYDCCNDGKFDATKSMYDDVTCGDALNKGYISSINKDSGNAKAYTEGYIVKWPGYKGYYMEPMNNIDKCYTLNINNEMTPEDFATKYTYTQDRTSVDVPTISLPDGTNTNYLYAGDNTNKIMNPTYPGGLCYQKKENGIFNENTCMGGDPLFPKVSKCIPIDEAKENINIKSKSVINLKGWANVDIGNIKHIWDTDENYKLGICEPFEKDHVYGSCDDKNTYLSDCSELIHSAENIGCVDRVGCVSGPMINYPMAQRNDSDMIDGPSTIIDSGKMLALTPVDKRTDLKINFKRMDRFEGHSIHETIYTTIWLPNSCANPKKPSNNTDCPGCVNGCNSFFGGSSEDSIPNKNIGWNAFPKEISNIPLKNNSDNISISIPAKYIGFEKVSNYDDHDNNAIMASGGRILFHTLPINQNENITKYVGSLDNFDQIEFTIQYRTNKSPNGIVTLDRMYTNFSAVDSLRSIYFNVKDKVSNNTIEEITCSPNLKNYNLDDICTRFYSRNITDIKNMNDWKSVIKKIVELNSKWYEIDKVDKTIDIDTDNTLNNLDVENCHSPGGCETGSFKRISQKCLGIKKMSDYGLLQKTFEKLSTAEQKIIDPTENNNIDNLLEQLGHFKEIRRYYKYCKKHDTSKDKTLYYYFGPASLQLLISIYAADSDGSTYNLIMVGADKDKVDKFKNSLPDLDALLYFDSSVDSIETIADNFHDIFTDDPNLKYLFPDATILNIPGVTDDYIKQKVLCVTMNYIMLSYIKIDMKSHIGVKGGGINSQGHVVSPYINSMLQRGYGDLISIKKGDYTKIIINPRKGRSSMLDSEKWTRSFKIDSKKIGDKENYCKGVVENIIDRGSVRELHGSDDFFFNDWIDLVLGKDTLISDNVNLGKEWGKGCLQYPISYGDACDPQSSSIISNYTDQVDITIGLYE